MSLTWGGTMQTANLSIVACEKFIPPRKGAYSQWCARCGVDKKLHKETQK